MEAIPVTPAKGTAIQGQTSFNRKVRHMDKAPVMEHLRVLRRLESETYPPCEDYLTLFGPSHTEGVTGYISERWRGSICEWCYEVVDHFQFDREVVSIALNYLDRAVAAKARDTLKAIPYLEFQLIAVTSVYMAIKLHGAHETHDGPRRRLRIDAFVELSRGHFEAGAIECMERSILSTLNWRVNPPTLLRFISNLLELLPEWSPLQHAVSYRDAFGEIYDYARYFSELSVCVPKFSFTLSSSEIAFSAILCAIEALQATRTVPDFVCSEFLENVAEATGLQADEPQILSARKMLRELYPSIFGRDNEHHVFANHACTVDQPQSVSGKKSPVCVLEEQAESPNTRRKRSRSSDDDKQPLYSSL
jgi:lipoyl(octanoyl) transferase